MKALLYSGWVSLRRRKLRTALTVGGIAIGTAMVVLISGIGTIGERAVRQELESMGINGLSVSSSEGLTRPCLSSIRALPMVTDAMPLMIKSALVHFGGEDYTAFNCGIDAGADQVISLELLYGRLLTAGDVAGGAAVCVVDEALAREAYGRADAVGKTLTVEWEGGSLDLRVVGVTATGSSLLQTVTAMIPYLCYLPYTTLQEAVGTQTFDQIAVRVDDASRTQAAEEAIRRVLAYAADEIGTLQTENLAAQRERLDMLTKVLSLALTAIGGVSLLVSGFGIMTVMLSSVHERTREIGIKKAIGATRGRILLEFLTGALLLSLLGALFGTAVGAAVIVVGCRLLGIAPVWSYPWIGGAFLLTLAVGVLFGAYPAYTAAGLPPVEALRGDS